MGVICMRIPIDEDTALRYATSLYSIFVPELAEAKAIFHDDYGYYSIQAVGIDNAIYYIDAEIGRLDIFKIRKEWENGEEVLLG